MNTFDVSGAIQNVDQGRLKDTFDKLALNGVNHKIRSFFIRDIIYLLGKEDMVRDNCSNALFAFPVDTWVRTVLSTINFNRRLTCDARRADYGTIQKDDFKLASAAIQACYDQQVSPIKLNMGIWYFSSQCVGDMRRLKRVLRNGDDAVIQEASPFDDLF
ncbi:MAG: hypothetical protein M1470_12635 [Bacteroidetes bacterium]|nr:hypothetical protein [Bacteroidota bacterium]MCL5738011.1 hypothetical protein [Bacteroidota bacterium]